MGVLSRLVRPLIDFVYPATCCSCQKLLQDGERHICRSCWQSIPRLDSHHALFRATRAKLLESGVVDDVVSVFVFEKDDAFQDLVHLLKYDGFRSAGVQLGRELGTVAAKHGLKPDVLLPVPLHRVKLRERGFNQAELIARGASGVLQAPVNTEWLMRRRNTATQTQLTLIEREQNVRGAFFVSDQARAGAAGATVLMIDDVITTGATIAACAAELRSVGAATIIAASAALAE